MTSMVYGSQRPVEGLTVLGEATRDASPEIVEFFFDLHSVAPTATMATQENSGRINQLRQALAVACNDQVELLAGGAAVWPVVQALPPVSFLSRPLLTAAPAAFASPALMPMPAAVPDSPPFVGYHACTSVKMTVRDTLQLGEALDTVARAGALPTGGVRFLPRNENELRRTLLEDAIQDASGKANTLAAAAGRTPGNAVAITEDFSSYPPQFFGNGYRMRGPLSFSARVLVTYQLQ